ncbi:MAG: pyridoxamine 5'-phosphate oxidase family protein [Candidatus Omnitrophica bacterium]|nr:pyridoxamine 5'-phosphate oxidase family protein [Candidatus Omnitrophota bacterium]
MEAKGIREFLAGRRYGALATQSLDLPGYPFGSLVPYCLDRQGCPILRLSALAQHTRNILKNPKASLTVWDVREEDILGSTRVTCLGDVVKVTGEEAEQAHERYDAGFPMAGAFGELDFSFFKLKPVRIRYILGFGRMGWVEASEYESA